ncbi:MAG: YkgJ family cysteine cluster protein [Candidatus Diapherotrites archaeon]|nr:YkgJ family cysteine cluster protein [Candidatus Diapherotrites archaeon]
MSNKNKDKKKDKGRAIKQNDLSKIESFVFDLTSSMCTRCGLCCRAFSSVMIDKETKKFASKKGIPIEKPRLIYDGGKLINKIRNKTIPVIIDVSEADIFFPLALPNGFYSKVPSKDILFFAGNSCPFYEGLGCSIHNKKSYPLSCRLYPVKFDSKNKVVLLDKDCKIFSSSKQKEKFVNILKKNIPTDFTIFFSEGFPL